MIERTMRLVALFALSSLVSGAALEPHPAAEQLLMEATRAGAPSPAPLPAPDNHAGLGVEGEVAAQLKGSDVPPSFIQAAFADPRRKLLPEIPPQAGKPAEELPYEKY